MSETTNTPTPTNEQQDAQGASSAPHHPRCYQTVGGVPDGLPPDLCDCRTLQALDLAAVSAAAPDEREALARAFAEHHARKVVYAIDYEHADVALTALAARPAPTVSAPYPRAEAEVLRTTANDLADWLGSSDLMADEISDHGIDVILRWLRERADQVEREGRAEA